MLKGVRPVRLVLRHALPNAIGPIANAVALSLSFLLGGIVIVETVFNYPGLAKLMVDAVSTRDVPLVQACAMIFCAGYLLLVLIADIASILSNPRLRYSMSGAAETAIEIAAAAAGADVAAGADRGDGGGAVPGAGGVRSVDRALSGGKHRQSDGVRADDMGAPAGHRLSGTRHAEPRAFGRALHDRRGAAGDLIASGAGTLLGMLAASWGGAADQVLSRAMDTLISFPSLIFSLVVIAGLGSSAPSC